MFVVGTASVRSSTEEVVAWLDLIQWGAVLLFALKGCFGCVVHHVTLDPYVAVVAA